MASIKWVTELLDENNVRYQQLTHSDVFTSQAVAQREHFSGHRVAKVVVVIADGRPVQLVLPASRKVSLQRVHDILGAQEVRLASEGEIQSYFTDCEVGALPPFPHWKDVGFCMDASMKVDGDILFQSGTHHDSIQMAFNDWYNLVHPRVESFAFGEVVASNLQSEEKRAR